MKTINNPILPGFNPDPSIVRVDDDYYIATSTFEWYGGVQIHHSRGLVHWRLLTRVLTHSSHLDMVGNPCSGGIWAPCLSYHEGLFYLVYTDVKSLTGVFKDNPNYMVTASNIMGPWSAPVFLNASGFDPSLFHDDDGRKWLINMQWDHRPGRNNFGGILLQHYCPDEKRLEGPITTIFRGTDLGVTEGPHLYKRNGFYYLMTAEGGTGYNHAVTMARSKRLEGPYEVDPQNPILTSRDNPHLTLQKAGHASIVETQGGEWYMVHLCARPVGHERRCILGRETAIQKCRWSDDGWLRLEDGGRNPRVSVPSPGLPEHVFAAPSARDDFDGERLSIHWSTLRDLPNSTWLSLEERPGHLRLYGRQSLESRHYQSLVARRIQAFDFRARTSLEFSPACFQQMAGLICFYNTQNWYYLRVTADENKGSVVGVAVNDNGSYREYEDCSVALGHTEVCHLCVELSDGRALQFVYSTDATNWQPLGPVLDATILSDEYAMKRGWGFTGAFVGLCCQDLTGQGLHADFDYFTYEETYS